MRKRILSIFGIIAVLSIPFSPVFADEPLPVAPEETAVTPVDTESTIGSTTPSNETEPEATSTPSDAGNDTNETSGATDPLATLPEADVVPHADAEPFAIDASIVLPDGCDVTDDLGTVHSFTASTSPSGYLAICALVQAKADGVISGFTLTDAGFGLYLSSVNGVDAGATEYWALEVNDTYASCGADCLPLVAGDALTLIRTDWMTNAEYDRVTLHVTALEKNVVVPNHCTVTVNGLSLSFPEGDSDSLYVAICALESAKESGAISGFEKDLCKRTTA